MSDCTNAQSPNLADRLVEHTAFTAITVATTALMGAVIGTLLAGPPGTALGLKLGAAVGGGASCGGDGGRGASGCGSL